MGYPDRSAAEFLLSVFKSGFKLNYAGPRYPVQSSNLVSAREETIALHTKLLEDRSLGRIIGPYALPPISNLRVNSVGLIPKSTGGWRLITNLSSPAGLSVNDFIDKQYCHVQYSKFDTAVDILQKIGKSAYMAKADIKSAFNLCPVWPADFSLLGIKTEQGYWVQKMLPMGASCSCQIFEKFSSFIQWLVKKISQSDNIDHLLDDFFFAESSYFECLRVLHTFESLCSDINIPLCEEKMTEPLRKITYLGLELDAELQVIRVPSDKVLKAKTALLNLLESNKIRLNQLQKMVGLLNFICKAIPAGRAFNRRFYDIMAKAKRPHHYIRVTTELVEDAKVWLNFLENFNGQCSFNELNWVQNSSLEFFTDASGNRNLGCGCYFQGRWSVFQWPDHWENTVFSDITYLELVPIVLAFCLWCDELKDKKIMLRSDNDALVHILNKKSSKDKQVMNLVRYLVLLTLQNNIQVKALHIPGKVNTICDAISRFQWERLKKALPVHAARHPSPVPERFLHLFNRK